MTTITVTTEVRDELAAMKPQSLSWSEYLRAVLDNVDQGRLLTRLESILEEEHRLALERVRSRYESARKRPDTLLSADEAREAVRRIQES